MRAHVRFLLSINNYFLHLIIPDATDYEQKLLYLQALGNLKFGKVTDYLDPIIRDETQSDDIRFVATWIKESVAEQSTSNERRENYETFWPIFENRSAPLELRAAAFIILLTSNPTSARLMSIHTLMESEPSPHLVNFYRTTLLSLAGTTQPCYQKLYVIVAFPCFSCRLSAVRIYCHNIRFLVVFCLQASLGIINNSTFAKTASQTLLGHWKLHIRLSKH